MSALNPTPSLQLEHSIASICLNFFLIFKIIMYMYIHNESTKIYYSVCLCPKFPVFFPGESHEQRSLANYSALCRKESDTTEDLTHTTHKACITRVIVCVFFVTCFYSTLCFWQSFRFIHFRYYVNSTVDEYSPIYPFYFLLFPNLSCVLLLYTGLQ